MDWETYICRIADESWEETQEQCKKKLSWNKISYNYRAEHNALVISMGMQIGERLKADRDVLKAALTLHDVGRSKVKKGHAEAGARMAGEILQDTDFPKEKIKAVQYAISTHVGWDESVPETLEARVLWDADKLSKLGACIVIQRAMNMALMGKNGRDVTTYFNNWLKTAEQIKKIMKTEPGSEMAEERYKILKMFVTALNNETPQSD